MPFLFVGTFDADFEPMTSTGSLGSLGLRHLGGERALQRRVEAITMYETSLFYHQNAK